MLLTGKIGVDNEICPHKHYNCNFSCHRDFYDLRDKNGDLLCLAWVATTLYFARFKWLSAYFYSLLLVYVDLYPYQFIYYLREGLSVQMLPKCRHCLN